MRIVTPHELITAIITEAGVIGPFAEGAGKVRASQPAVCIVSPLFNPAIGGPGRQAVIMAKALRSKGVQVTVIARRLAGVPDAEEAIEVHRLPTLWPSVHNLTEFSWRNALISISFSAGALVALFRLWRQYNLVHFYGAGLPLLLCLLFFPFKRLGKKVAAKTVGARGGMEAGGLDDFFLKPLLVLLFRKTDMFIAVNGGIRRRLLQEGYGEDTIVQIPNGVDTQAFFPVTHRERTALREKFGFAGKTIFLYSGRLVKGKGLDLLAGAMTRVVREVPEALLVLIGAGDYAATIRDTARLTQIEAVVRMEGAVEQVADYLNAADVFVFPSLSEGMPNALLEAMACGLPVVASRIDGVVDVVADGASGLLVEPGDEAGLASAMTTLANDEDLRSRLGAAAKRGVEERCSLNAVAEAYIDLYHKLINRSRGDNG